MYVMIRGSIDKYKKIWRIEESESGIYILKLLKDPSDIHSNWITGISIFDDKSY